MFISFGYLHLSLLFLSKNIEFYSMITNCEKHCFKISYGRVGMESFRSRCVSKSLNLVLRCKMVSLKKVTGTCKLNEGETAFWDPTHKSVFR